MHPVFPVAQMRQYLFRSLLGFGPERCARNKVIVPTSEVRRLVLAHDAGHTSPPDILDSVPKGQVGVVSRMALQVTVAPHYVRPEIGGCNRMVHPDFEREVVLRQFFQSPNCVRSADGAIAVRVETINMA